MATKIPQFVRGSRRANDQYTGPEGSVSLDMDRKALHVHDGETPGGETWLTFPEAPKDGTYYTRRLGQWVPVPLRPDPVDNGEYIRQANQWVALEETTWASSFTSTLSQLQNQMGAVNNQIGTLSDAVDQQGNDHSALVGRVATLEQEPGGISANQVRLVSELFDATESNGKATLSIPDGFMVEDLYLRVAEGSGYRAGIDHVQQPPTGISAGGMHQYTNAVFYLKDREIRKFDISDGSDEVLVGSLPFAVTIPSTPDDHEMLVVHPGNSSNFPYMALCYDDNLHIYNTQTGDLLYNTSYSDDIITVRWAGVATLIVMLKGTNSLHVVTEDSGWSTAEYPATARGEMLESAPQGYIIAFLDEQRDLVLHDTSTQTEVKNLGAIRQSVRPAMDEYSNYIVYERLNGLVEVYDIDGDAIVYQKQFFDYTNALNLESYGDAVRRWTSGTNPVEYHPVARKNSYPGKDLTFEGLYDYVVERIMPGFSGTAGLLSLSPRVSPGPDPRLLVITTPTDPPTVELVDRTGFGGIVVASATVNTLAAGNVAQFLPKGGVLSRNHQSFVVNFSQAESSKYTGVKYQIVAVGHQL